MNLDKRYKSHHDALGHYKEHLSHKPSSLEALEDFLSLSSPDEDKLQALYFHIPFCDNICAFCNLNRTVIDDSLNAYVDLLIDKIKWYGKTKYIQASKISSIYFGGGTPTVLSPDHFRKIFVAIHENFHVIEDCETSVETTLHNLSKETIETFNALGVRRISIGIQTFSDRGRRVLNRKYSKSETIDLLKAIKKTFKGMVCIDIIYNYPDQTLEELNEDIRLIKDLEIKSISFYSLMLHKGSVLSRKITEADLLTELDRKYHDHFVDSLMATGDYELLELTKIVKKGTDQYQYIQVRNTYGDVIPIGKGAGGNINHFEIYNVNERMTVCQKGTSDTNFKLYRIYGKTQKTHFHLKDDFKFLNDQELEIMESLLKDFVTEGLVTKAMDTYKLTNKGLFYGNNVSAEIVERFILACRGA